MNTQNILFVALSISLSLAANGRESKTINDGWTFSRKGKTEKVHLPHCWNEDAYHTSNYYRGEGSYIRNIRIPEALNGKKVYLRIDGAASKSKVLIDDREAGKHIGAYSTHYVDITPYVSDGLDHNLTVIVDNSDPAVPPYSADFTFMGGLYRDVSLVITDPVHLDFSSGPSEGFKIITEKGSDNHWKIAVNGDIRNDSPLKKKVKVNAILRNIDGAVVAQKSQDVRLNALSAGKFTINFDKIADPQLWSPENPALYTMEVSVQTNGIETDKGIANLGFRTYDFDSEGRFLLNGQPYKLRGMCRHQDQAPMGIALTDEMHRRDMKMIKDMGANFIRISHYPQDDAILEMCDRLGLIAWQEIPVIDYVPETENFDNNAEIMLRDMIRRHYNHPSIAMWGYMNEILLRVPHEERDAAYRRTKSLAERLENATREEDPHRLTTMAFHGSDVYHDAGLSDITDVKGWNLYQGWYGGRLDEFEKYLSRQHRDHPSHRLLVSEYGAGSDRRLHSLRPEAFDFSMEYQQDYLEHYLPVIEDSTFVAGASHWNFIDFSSAKRAESMPHINNKGLVTNSRTPKDVYYYYSAMWHDPAKDTVAHIAVNDWRLRCEVPDAKGKVVRPIKVYTNLPEVWLTVNGINYGNKEVVNCNSIFDVELKDGVNLILLQDAAGNVLDSNTIEMSIFDVTDGKLNPGTKELAINVGSNCYFHADDSGLIWLPDTEYNNESLYGHIGGKAVVTQDEIALTSYQPLLQRAMNGLSEYKIKLLPGRYEVELLFAEQGKPSEASAYMLGRNAGTASDKSIMDILINGEIAEKGFSPSDASGAKTMVKRRYFADVTSDGLSIGFNGVSTLAGIKVRKL